VSVERHHATHDQRRRRHHYKKPRRFEFSGHALERQLRAILRGNRNLATRSLTIVERLSDYVSLITL
jgi:hypothetical protein